MEIVDISIAIVKNNQDKFLISRRADGAHQGGKWEFPGGKVEVNESPEQAMNRELYEEVGLTVVHYQLLDKFFFDYGDKQLNLYFYLINEYNGVATAKEHQPLKWVSKVDLEKYDFPKANQQVIAKL